MMEEMQTKTILDDGANGEIENVMISELGSVTGSDAEGNPI